MHCVHCEKRIINAINNAGIPVEVDLASKTVTVNDDEQVTVVMAILNKIGFHAE